MISNINEDELLLLLNDVNITDDELSDEDLTDLEKSQIRKSIITNIKHKTSSKKKKILAASIAGLICISIPLVQKDVLASMLEKLSIIPGIGKVVSTDNGLVLNKILTDNGVTLNTIYIDKTKILASLTVKSEDNYSHSSFKLTDNNGKSYELKTADTAGQIDGTKTYKIEFNGSVKLANNYTLSAMNNRAKFSLKDKDFKEASPAKNLYSITNGITTLNITSIQRKNNILKLDYYFTESINHYSGEPSYNLGTFENEEENKKRGFAMIDSSIDRPFFKLYDENKNSEYSHSSSSSLTFQNESLFNLNKLSGNKLKLSLPSVNYYIGTDAGNNDFNIKLDIPKEGSNDLNLAYEYDGFKFNIVSIKRLSDKQVEILYKPIPTTNPNLKILDMQLGGEKFSESIDSTDKKGGSIKTILTSSTTIGNTINLSRVTFNVASVGPYELELDLDKIK